MSAVKRKDTGVRGAIRVRYIGTMCPELVGRMVTFVELAEASGIKRVLIRERWANSGRPLVIDDWYLRPSDNERAERFLSTRKKVAAEDVLEDRPPLVEQKPWPPRDIDDVNIELTPMQRGLLRL